MNTEKIILKFYKKDSIAYRFLTIHSKAVRKKAIEIAYNNIEYSPDLQFIEEASMLHDIGIIMTNATNIGCNGKEPYICHGVLGRKMLEDLGFPKHGLVCERHIGSGISKEEIISQKLPIPLRDMLPLTVEEEIVCLADKFFSKNDKYLESPRPIEGIKKKLEFFGQDNIQRFDALLRKYKIDIHKEL